MAALIREDALAHTGAENYVPPEEPAVREKLEWFRDQKLAFMVHWGIYSQLGITESWPLSDGDAHWSRRGYNWEPDSARFRAQYTALNRTFMPLRFQADEWADFARDAGFRYLIFTTKHHDGFCMYDSAYTDYKITAAACPFHTHAHADVTRALFDAFRQRGMGIAAYFSKPDWHCPWYWAEGCEKPVACDRNPTYDPRVRPDLWRAFTEFTHQQMMELVTRYGPLDILWLDGGQVRASNGQDIDLKAFADDARRVQPGLIIADRTVGGACENYITPEQTLPDHALSVPWESCVSIGRGFAYSYDDTYRSPRNLVNLLITVVGRGGNLALNLGAQPDGRLPARGMQAALGLGEWLAANGDAIYGTRSANPCERPMKQGPAEGLHAGARVFFTCRGERVFALLPLEESDHPREISIPYPGARAARLLDGAAPLFCVPEPDGLRVRLPEAAQPPLAMAFEIML